MNGPPANYRLVDISMGMDEFVFPGDSPVVVDGPFDVVGTENPEWVYQFCAPTQAGTHVQGPHYFLEHGPRIDSYPLSRFEGWAHLVEMPQRGADIDSEDLRCQLGSVEIAGDIVMFRSGHMDELVAGAPLESHTRPGLSLAGAQWLIDRNIAMVAIDSVGIESRSTRNFEVNVMLCENDVLILEGLVNLRSITTESVWLTAYPLKLSGVEGTPVRAAVKIPIGGR
jgi:kynurenine formamidase